MIDQSQASARTFTRVAGAVPPQAWERPSPRGGGAAPPQAWFGVSAVFHYLGPAFAVLLFPHIGVLGVAWLRIASATLVFAPLTRPWRTLRFAGPTQLRLLI